MKPFVPGFNLLRFRKPFSSLKRCLRVYSEKLSKGLAKKAAFYDETAHPVLVRLASSQRRPLPSDLPMAMRGPV